ncbi:MULTISPECIES: hypothetical protein [Bacillus cereus group]|uniref:hypothetical protein n=1 Tax=Bacillus TaxID=1386 RepID=UPI0002EBC1ED|nr:MULTISPECIES: hypothetical protein [Bacillus cereus group]MEB9630901.1 hypothetical protein [Bacillus anthracis]
MSEQKNGLSLKVDVDTKEANKSIKELTAAANECVEAFERLEKKLERFNSAKLQIDATNLINLDAVEIAKRALRINGVRV